MMGGRMGWPGFMLLLALPELGCGEPQCPQGYSKEDKVCRRIADAGDPALPGDPDAETEEGAPGDASQNTESGATHLDAAPRPDASGGEASLSDTGSAPDAMALDAEAPADVGPPIVAVECDATRACPQSGYLCIAGKCSATCAQTQCDPHALCGMDGNQRPQCVCAAGYTGNGITCTPLSCPLLEPPLHGSVSRTQASVGQDATYTCENGYDLVGAIMRRCEVNGQWSAGAEPTCVPKRCAMVLAPPAHGSVAIQEPVYPNSAEYACDTGFTLTGSIKRQCQANGQWAGNAPTCRGCGDGVLDGDLGEQCEPTRPPHDAWTCSAVCRLKTAYTSCRGNDFSTGGSVGQGIGCNAGEACFFGGCAPACSIGSDACPSAPRGEPRCEETFSTFFCILRCSSSADCSPGLLCAAGQGATPGCVGCFPASSAPDPSFVCPAGKTCFQPASNLAGVCR